jgi:hypothetical protein
MSPASDAELGQAVEVEELAPHHVLDVRLGLLGKALGVAEHHQDPALYEDAVLERRGPVEEPLEVLPAPGERRVLVLRDAGDPEEQQVPEGADAVGDVLGPRHPFGQKGVGLLGGAQLVQREGGGTRASGQDRMPSGPLLPHRGHR